jgi:hypothetical protein
MTSTTALVAEMKVLRVAVKAHSARLTEAQWQRTLAMEAAGVPLKWGGSMYDLDAKDEWRYPSVEAASRQVAALEDDAGYFWACSRLRDLEGLLGEAVPQLPLRTEELYVPLFRGHIPPANPAVAAFMMGA